MILVADVLLPDAYSEPVEPGAVVVVRGRVVACGSRNKIVKAYSRHPVHTLHKAVLLPGLVNAHVHLELPSLSNVVSGGTYTDWVLNLLRAKADLTDRDYTEAARRNSDAVIRSGTTTVGEICTHDTSPSVLSRCGLRAVIYHEIITMERNGSKLTMPSMSRSRRLVRHGLSPHSPHTVSESALTVIRRYAEKRGLPVSMHVAETGEERLLLQRRKSGLERLYAWAGWDPARAPRSSSSFDYLHRTGMLGPSFLAVHAVHADQRDRSLIRRSGACIAHCPRSNRALRVGRMPLLAFLRSGIPVGLGTDSLASVPSLNLWDEMRYAYRIHRPSGISAADIVALATLGGAKALGMEREIGSLKRGKQADCIAVPLPAKDTGDLCSDLLRETKSCMMNMVNGKIIYQLHHRKRT